MKDLYIVTNDRLGKIIWSFCNSLMDLLTLFVMYFKCSPKLNLLSKNIHGVFDFRNVVED